MINHILFSTAFLFILIFLGCDKASEEQLHGKWMAAELLEEDMPKDMDLKDVYFQFSENGTYVYNGNLKYREAGRFHVANQLLYTTDTLSDERIEKAVKISLLTSDSLYFMMNDGGKQQLFKLYKTQ